MPNCKTQAKIHAKLKKLYSKITKNDDINYKTY